MWNLRKIECVLATCAAAVLSVCLPGALGQSSAAATSSGGPAVLHAAAPTSAKQVLDHLNMAMRWYRQWDGVDLSPNRPADALYIDNGRTLAQQVLQLDFQSALAQSALIAQARPKRTPETAGAQQNVVDVHNIFLTQQQVGPQIDNLKAEIDALDRKLAVADAKQRSGLIDQRNVLQGQLELARALQENLQKLTSFMMNAESANGAATELSGKILGLQRTIPAALVGPAGATGGGTAKKQVAVKPIAGPTVSGGNDNEGLIGQVGRMFHLTASLRSLEELSDRGAELQTATEQLRAPLLAALRATLHEGKIAIQAAAPAPADLANTGAATGTASGKATAKKVVKQMTAAALQAGHLGAASVPAPVQGNTPQNPAAQIAEDPVEMAALIQRFKLLSNATLPLSQALILIEQTESNVAQLQNSIEHEYAGIVRSVLLRVAAILISLGVIWLFSELWRRATFRYVRDARRRRQFLILRRGITGFCMFVVIVLGFVSDFSSLATYAGLITAGVAVALQAVILSIAAYFFLVGRYGVRVGDRVTVVYSGSVSVSGEVLDIGLVRFYLMELTGAGIDMQPTGRIAVFPNSVLFQTTPLFKQLPGTEYTWRELAFPLHPDTDPKLAESAMLAAVSGMYEKFGPVLEKQHLSIEQSMGVHMEVPKPYTRVRFIASGIEAVVRYPIPMREAAAQDDRMVIEATEMLRKNPSIRLKDGAMPELRSAIKA